MPSSLLFNENNVPEAIIQGREGYIKHIDGDEMLWISLKPEDSLNTILPEIIDTSRAFTEDLIEEQRPRIAKYQTLEPNDDTYSVLVFSFPTTRIFKDDEFQLQVTFVLLDNKLFSIPSTETNILPDIMAKIKAKNQPLDFTRLFNYILSELVEMSIRVIDSVEDYIDKLERQIIRGGIRKGWFRSLIALKGRLFDASRLIKADIEHIREILVGEVPELKEDEIHEQIEDRSLFLLDDIELIREDLSNMINLHLAIASNAMNKQFYWLTILGAILAIPTIMSSIYGMNLPDLPILPFWWLMLVMLVITFLGALTVKMLLPRQYLD